MFFVWPLLTISSLHIAHHDFLFPVLGRLRRCNIVNMFPSIVELLVLEKDVTDFSQLSCIAEFGLSSGHCCFHLFTFDFF